MARCMLCSSPAGAADVVCPRCGGALEEDPADATRVDGIDLTKAAGPARRADPTGPVPPSGAWGSPTGPPLEGWGPPPGWAPPPGAPAEWDPPGAQPGGPPGPPPGVYGYGSGPPPGEYGDGSAPPGPPGEYGYGYGYGYGPPVGPGGPPVGPPPSLGGYSYGPGYGAPWYGYPGFVPQPPIEGLAIGSLVTSIAGLLLSPLTFVSILACPVGAVLGHVALRRIDEQGKGGRGLALGGAIVGWIGTALLAAGVILLAIIIVAAVGTAES